MTTPTPERAAQPQSRGEQEWYSMGSMIDPAGLPEPSSAWTWAGSGFGTIEADLPFDQIPQEPGRVCCRLGQRVGVVFDLAWGKYGEVGSKRATYFVPAQ